jgi:hypothetical protein
MTMETTPRFLNGVFQFEGRGLTAPALLHPSLTYTVPSDRRAQLIYFRAGHSADALVNLVLLRAGKPMRMFPLGAKGAMHVPLAVVEDIFLRRCWSSTSPRRQGSAARSSSISA